MLYATELVVLKLLTIKGKVSTKDVKDIIIRGIQVAYPIVYNSSPHDIEEEFLHVIQLINEQTNSCVVLSNNIAYLSNNECKEKLQQIYDSIVSNIKTDTNLFSVMLRPAVEYLESL